MAKTSNVVKTTPKKTITKTSDTSKLSASQQLKQMKAAGKQQAKTQKHERQLAKIKGNASKASGVIDSVGSSLSSLGGEAAGVAVVNSKSNQASSRESASLAALNQTIAGDIQDYAEGTSSGTYGQTQGSNIGAIPGGD